MHPEENYKLTVIAFDLARKNWTNRRYRFHAGLDALCKLFVEELGDDDAPEFNEMMPDTRAVTVEDEAHLGGLLGKRSAFLETLTAHECGVAELLAEDRSVPKVMAVTGESKYAVQQQRKSLAVEWEEFRLEPTIYRN